MILLNLLWVLAAVALVSAVLRIIHLFRARAMRSLAARWGFQYIGPPAPKWWNPYHAKVSPPLPHSLSYGWQFRQVWNVMECPQKGLSLFIFDGIIGSKGGHPCTFVACQTEQNPFGAVNSPDRLIRSHGWTVLYGVWFLWFSWTMPTRRLENHLKELPVGTAEQQLS